MLQTGRRFLLCTGPYQCVSLHDFFARFIDPTFSPSPRLFYISRSDDVLCRIFDRFSVPEIGSKRAKIRRLKILERLGKIQILQPVK